MGCSKSILSSESTIVTKKNQVIDSKSLIEACRSGDIVRVAILLKTITFTELNKADWTTGNTPLHLATYHGHIDIVRLLLNHGAMRNILNYELKIPANYASTIEMEKLFQRLTIDSLIRFVGDDSNKEEIEKIEVLQSSLDATQFFMEYESRMSYTGQWNIIQTVEALQKAPELKNIPGLDVVWNLFEQAREKTDAKYLIRAYTVESQFYKILNQKLVQQHLKKSANNVENHQMQNTMAVFNQSFTIAQSLLTESLQTDNSEITDWVHRYMGTIHTLIYQPSFQFNGLTYRGMWAKKENLLYYSENQLYICNKTLISTSKNFKIAKRFIDESIPLAEQIPVMCTYLIDSYTSFKAIDIHTISEYPEEEEVLIFPGIPFEIRKIGMNTTINMIEIKLVPMLSNVENLRKKVLNIFH
jgi:hypothetical protein